MPEPALTRLDRRLAARALRRFDWLAVLMGSLILAGAAQAQSVASWPARPVRIVAPFAAGGSADTLGRLVAQKLSDAFRQSFIVENRGGAGGVVGSDMVAKASPDGYTLVVSGVASHVLAPAISKVPFDAMTDFTHIALFGGPPIALCVTPSLPVRDVREFVAYARTHPLAYGSPGTGTQGQLMAEMFRQAARIDLAHVPYKGASPAIVDLIAGTLPATSTSLTTASTQIHGGKIRAIALSSQRRLPDYPDVPTFVESGYPSLVATVWFSLSGPAGMPAEIVQRLNAEVRRALATSDIRARLRLEGIETNDLDATQFTEFMRSEIARWTPIVKKSSARND
jgi:tripartite-type tricarboxylate transporter receptor subunit TctC